MKGARAQCTALNHSRKLMTNELVFGCRACQSIFAVRLYNFDELGIDPLHCPVCGEEAEELGYLPAVTEKDGVYYLVDMDNVQGPYATAELAQKELWAWFGAPDAKKPIEKITGRLKLITGHKIEGGQARDQAGAEDPDPDGTASD